MHSSENAIFTINLFNALHKFHLQGRIVLDKTYTSLEQLRIIKELKTCFKLLGLIKDLGLI